MRTSDEDRGEYTERKKPAPMIRFLPIFLATLAILGFVAVVWYAYKQGKSGHYEEVVPTIRADVDAIKERPQEPGGMEIPNQDRFIFKQLEESQGENLYENAPVPESGEPASGQGAVPAPEAAESAPATVPEEAIDAIPPMTAQEESLPPTAPAMPRAEATPSEPVPAASTPEPVEPPAPAKAAAASGKIYRVQLASLASQDAAQKALKSLAKKLDSVLTGGQELSIVEADLGAKGTYYRVQAGDFASKQDAEAMCQSYKAMKGSCLVVAK